MATEAVENLSTKELIMSNDPNRNAGLAGHTGPVTNVPGANFQFEQGRLERERKFQEQQTKVWTKKPK